ncbi:unnamed protein product [Euphydryas editha]|uniref:Uncharacterized protein n=1 Tax=Euphydryas editha TaxID=104508 RepID=A0AAU9ULM0_EUPED|nr:unnamed protein product [Euphydryas editha]
MGLGDQLSFYRLASQFFINVLKAKFTYNIIINIFHPTSPPHLNNWFHYLYVERRPPAPTGTMKVREGWNACRTSHGGTAGAARGGACSRFPGEECQREQQSLLAAIHPAPPPC